MIEDRLKQVALALARIPTAPYHESQIRSEVLRLLTGLPHLTTRLDRFGNVIARYRHRPARGQSLTLVAHLDHPGFVIPCSTFRKARCAEFLGGVAQDYFTPQSVLFFNRHQPAPLGVCQIKRIDWSRPRKRVYFDSPFPRGAEFGMWDLPIGQFTRDLFINRNCDDLVGVATIVALLIRLAESNARGEVTALLTRAEEVGFHGALASLKASPPPPRHAPILSLETSNARGFAKLGAGLILRVGDRSSIFTPSVTSWMQESLETLKKDNPQALYQRLLMSGGSCEGTVFQQSGYTTGALCLALKNYHNMGTRGQIAAEAVSLSDWQGLSRLLHHLATEATPYHAPKKRPALRGRLATLQQEALHAFSKYRD